MGEAGRDLWKHQVQPLAANRSSVVWIRASPRLQIAQPLCAPVSVFADKVKNCFQSLIWLPAVAIRVTVASPPTSGLPPRRSQLCFLSSLPLDDSNKLLFQPHQQAQLSWHLLAGPVVAVTGGSSYSRAVTAWSARAAFTTGVHSCLAFGVQLSRDVPTFLCKPTQHPAGTAAHWLLISNSWWHSLISKEAACMHFSCCLLCSITSSKWGWCISKDAVVSCNNTFLGLAILFYLRGEKPAKYKLDGTKKKENDFWTYIS